MPVLPLILIILGVLVAGSSFIYMAINFSSNTFSRGADRNHVKGMIFMLIGGMIAFIGFVTGGWQVIQALLSR